MSWFNKDVKYQSNLANSTEVLIWLGVKVLRDLILCYLSFLWLEGPRNKSIWY